MADPSIPADVRYALDRFTKQTSIEITEYACQLIAQIIEGVVRDPHASWRIQPDEAERHREHYVRALPDMLRNLAEDIAGEAGVRRPEALSTFDVLHGLRRIDAFCVIPKITASVEKLREIPAPGYR